MPRGGYPRRFLYDTDNKGSRTGRSPLFLKCSHSSSSSASEPHSSWAAPSTNDIRITFLGNHETLTSAKITGSSLTIAYSLLAPNLSRTKQSSGGSHVHRQHYTSNTRHTSSPAVHHPHTAAAFPSCTPNSDTFLPHLSNLRYSNPPHPVVVDPLFTCPLKVSFLASRAQSLSSLHCKENHLCTILRWRNTVGSETNSYRVEKDWLPGSCTELCEGAGFRQRGTYRTKQTGRGKRYRRLATRTVKDCQPCRSW